MTRWRASFDADHLERLASARGRLTSPVRPRAVRDASSTTPTAATLGFERSLVNRCATPSP
jgi:hypothetical protein